MQPTVRQQHTRALALMLATGHGEGLGLSSSDENVGLSPGTLPSSRSRGVDLEDIMGMRDLSQLKNPNATMRAGGRLGAALAAAGGKISMEVDENKPISTQLKAAGESLSDALIAFMIHSYKYVTTPCKLVLFICFFVLQCYIMPTFADICFLRV